MRTFVQLTFVLGLLAAPGQAVAGNVPSYMVTDAEARAVKVPVQPFRAPPVPYPAVDASIAVLEDYRRVLEAYLNKAMTMPSLAPGRSFKVFIIDDESLNASADGMQVVRVNKGTVERMDADMLLAILCHEMAHSAQNHSALEAAWYAQNPEGKRFDAAQQAAYDFIEKRIDTTRHVYRHDLAGYRSLRAQWEAAAKAYSEVSKTHEAEADAVGAMICARLGMPAPVVAASFSRFFDLAEAIDKSAAGGADLSAYGPDSVKDGEELTDVQSPVDVLGYLFSKDDHPTNKERADQFQRLLPTLQTQLDGKADFYKLWHSRYAGFKKGLSLAADELTADEAVSRNSRTIKRADGTVVRVKLPVCDRTGRRP